MESVFIQLGVVTIASAALGIVARLLKQPILLAYIAAGILLGSGGYHILPASAQTQDIAKIGIIFLLFLVGLELNVEQVKRLGRVVVGTGLIQMLISFAAAFVTATALGYGGTIAIYLGLAVAFSSTAVVLKRLSDRHELSALYGRVAVGVLLLQDVVAILALMVISGAGHTGFSSAVLASFLLRGTAFFLGTWLVTRYLLGQLFFYIARSTELLFLTSVAWAFLFALIAESIGFSPEIGAFVAGLSLATLPYNFEIISRVKPLKDFFLVVFFVMLGLQVSGSVIAHHWPLILALSGIALVVKGTAGSVSMMRLGYPKRPAYLTGAALGQMSEFSLLVVLLGVSLGHLPAELIGITAALLVVTITLNSYWTQANRFLYPVISPLLGLLGGPVRSRELRHRPKELADHVLMFGANRTGYHLLKTVEAFGDNVVVVDHNPEVIRRLQHRGVESVYGDMDDYELLRDLGLSGARMVISTVPNTSANLYLVKRVRDENPQALVITTADQISDALAMYAAGADYVILPHLLGGEQAAQIVEGVEAHLQDARAIKTRRAQHIAQLKRRQADILA